MMKTLSFGDFLGYLPYLNSWSCSDINSVIDKGEIAFLVILLHILGSGDQKGISLLSVDPRAASEKNIVRTP